VNADPSPVTPATGCAGPASGVALVVGVDVGGTKTHVRVASRDAVVADTVLPSTGWDPHPWPEAAAWLCRALDAVDRRWRSAAAVVIGAHGCDSPQTIKGLREALELASGRPCGVFNDGELLVPAAGLDDGIGVVLGTGAIAIGRLPGGGTVTAGGWGWLLGDEGAAPVIVRAALRAVLTRHELGGPVDALGSRVLAALGVATPPELVAVAHRATGPRDWGEHAWVVFKAAEEGSADARAVLDQVAVDVAALVERLAGRGVPVRDLVFAGGVARHQQGLVEQIRQVLVTRHPGTRVQVLTEPPVHGAVVLAARSAGWPDLSTPARAVC
jgi:N-acetylglucosamine kinase-like BadF-type ATPase